MVDPQQVAQAVRVLREGGVVAFPTDTVYALGCDARDAAALRRVFEIKGRPETNPIAVLLEGPEGVSAWAQEAPSYAQALARAWWPGALTLVVPRQAWVLSELTAGRASVGLRVPDHPLAGALLRAYAEACGRPGAGIAGPSANPSGLAPALSGDEVRAYFGDAVDLVLDGPCGGGVASTVVDCTRSQPEVLRAGPIDAAAIAEVAARAGGPL